MGVMCQWNVWKMFKWAWLVSLSMAQYASSRTKLLD